LVDRLRYDTTSVFADRLASLEAVGAVRGDEYTAYPADLALRHRRRTGRRGVPAEGRLARDRVLVTKG